MSFDELNQPALKNRTLNTMHYFAKLAFLTSIVCSLTPGLAIARPPYTWSDVEKFTRLLTKKPGDYNLHKRRADAYLDVEHLQDALKDYRVSLSLRADQPYVFAALARMDVNDGKVESAKENLRKAMASWREDSPDWQDAARYTCSVIDALASRKKLDVANEVPTIQVRMAQIKSPHPQDGGLVDCILGRLEELRGNKSKAQTLYLKSIMKTPLEIRRVAYAKTAWFYQRQKDFGTAMALLTEAMEQCKSAEDKSSLLRTRIDLAAKSTDLGCKDGWIKDVIDVLPEPEGPYYAGVLGERMVTLLSCDKTQFLRVCREIRMKHQRYPSSPGLAIADGFIDSLSGRDSLFRTKFARAVNSISRCNQHIAWSSRSQFYVAQKKFTQAFCDRCEALKICPPSTKQPYFNSAGQLLAQCDVRKDWSKLEANCNYLMLDFECNEFIPNFIDAVLSHEQIKAASKSWRALLSKQPNNASLKYMVGTADYRSHRLDSAIQCFSGAIALHPKWQAPLHKRSDCYRSMKRYKDAEADLTSAISIQPNLVLLISRAELFDELEKPVPGLTDVEQALQLTDKTPGGSPFKSQLFRLKADFLDMLERYAEAKIWRAKSKEIAGSN